jgi:hypothetical protein
MRQSKEKAARNGASTGASIGASLGSKGGPVSAGIGAGFGGAVGYLAGALSPCGGKRLVPDGGREPNEGRGGRGALDGRADHADRSDGGVPIPVAEAESEH